MNNHLTSRIRHSLALSCLLLCACSTVVPYEPRVVLTPQEARNVISRAFEEQPASHRPVEVAINDDAIRLGFSLTKVAMLAGGVTTIQRRETYYFANLKPPLIVKHNSRYQVALSNNEGSVARWVVFYDPQHAESFVDALAALTSAGRHQ